LTNHDYFSLSTSFWTATTERIDCNKCKSKRLHEKIKRIQNCNEAGENPVFQTDEFKYYRCAGAFKDARFSVIMNLKQSYDKGINPFGGAISDAPNKVIEMFNLIDSLVAEKQEKDAKEWQMK